jgi:hypothetical protein
MAIDERTLETIVRVAVRVKLEFILVGNAAAVLHDAPLTTDDFDLFIRHTPRNLAKLRAFAEEIGGVLMRPFEPTSEMRRVVAQTMSVDFVFRLGERQKFESVRSRAVRMRKGKYEIMVASLPDIIAAKQAAGRPKDKASLPILKDTLRIKQEMEKTET